MKRRNELKMKPAAVIHIYHMLSPRNFKIGSYTRSPHVGGLAAVSRHLAVVHGGGLATTYIITYIHTYIHTYIYRYIYTYGHIIYIYIHMCIQVSRSVGGWVGGSVGA